MQKKLLIVADDMGLAPAVDRAVLHCLQQRTISAPSLMPTSAYATALLQDFRDAGYLSIGWHLTLSEPTQRPITGALKVLCDGTGHFLGRDSVVQQLLRPTTALNADLRREIAAQLERVEQCGLRISHVSSHHHVHVLPCVAEALTDVLQTHARSALVRGYGAYVGASSAGAYPVLSEFAESSARFYRARGLQTTHTIGFRTFASPDEATLKAELETEPGNGQSLEWMVHLADYVTGDASLGHARQEEFALLQRRELVSAFEVQTLVHT
jgi:predicted glycoside hydrolase/deacetylase ChbG (UPF0249 family)